MPFKVAIAAAVNSGFPVIEAINRLAIAPYKVPTGAIILPASADAIEVILKDSTLADKLGIEVEVVSPVVSDSF
jgi:hypothetical protein